MTVKLWHSKDTRSLRPLWTLEEAGIPYELEMVPFPPRALKPDYITVNELGTVPFFVDGDLNMTESVAICHYLIDKYDQPQLGIDKNHPEYGDYLNWLYHSDATLTFPQTLYVRYALLEKDKTHLREVADSYRVWYLKRLIRLARTLESREFLCGGKFTIADIAIAYALFLGEYLGFAKDYEPQVMDYLNRLKQRPAFIKAQSLS